MIEYLRSFKLSGKQKSHLDGTVVAASADELGPSAGRVAGVNEGGVALQTLDPLPCLTVPHTYGLVRARREEHAKKTEDKKNYWATLLSQSLN